MLGGFILSKGYENFNNSETAFRKSTLIQERIGLVSTHMYKQFLDYQHATMNTTEIFAEMIDNLKAIAGLNGVTREALSTSPTMKKTGELNFEIKKACSPIFVPVFSINAFLESSSINLAIGPCHSPSSNIFPK